MRRCGNNRGFHIKDFVRSGRLAGRQKREALRAGPSHSDGGPRLRQLKDEVALDFLPMAAQKLTRRAGVPNKLLQPPLLHWETIPEVDRCGWCVLGGPRKRRRN